MRILIVCQYYSPEPFRITDMATAFVKMGHEIDVLTGIPNYPEGRFYKGYGLMRRRDEVLDGVRVIRAPIIPRGNGRAFSLIANFASFMTGASIKALFVRRGAYDVVLVYQLSPVTMAIPGIVAAWRAHVPVVLYIVDLWPESIRASGGTNNEVIYELLGRVVSWIYKRSARILITSQGFTTSILSRGQEAKNVRYIPQYPEDVYESVVVPEDDPSRGEIPDGFNVVFTGNIGTAQGLEVVLDAAERLAKFPEIRWILIGEGRARPVLQEAVAARGLAGCVLFLGRRPMARIPVYLALCDAALLCLKSQPLFALTFPAKTQSYLACGIPVIGSIDGDAAKVITEAGAGLVGPAGDARALAENVLAMYRSGPDVRKEYATNAIRFHKEHFHKGKIMVEIEKNLREVMEDSCNKKLD